MTKRLIQYRRLVSLGIFKTEGLKTGHIFRHSNVLFSRNENFYFYNLKDLFQGIKDVIPLISF